MISTMPGNLNVNEQRGKVFSLSCVVLEEKKILNAKTELANTSFCHASHFHSLILYDSVPHRFTSSPLWGWLPQGQESEVKVVGPPSTENQGTFRNTLYSAGSSALSCLCCGPSLSPSAFLSLSWEIFVKLQLVGDGNQEPTVNRGSPRRTECTVSCSYIITTQSHTLVSRLVLRYPPGLMETRNRPPSRKRQGHNTARWL